MTVCTRCSPIISLIASDDIRSRLRHEGILLPGPPAAFPPRPCPLSSLSARIIPRFPFSATHRIHPIPIPVFAYKPYPRPRETLPSLPHTNIPPRTFAYIGIHVRIQTYPLPSGSRLIPGSVQKHTPAAAAAALRLADRKHAPTRRAPPGTRHPAPTHTPSRTAPDTPPRSTPHPAAPMPRAAPHPPAYRPLLTCFLSPRSSMFLFLRPSLISSLYSSL